MIIHRYEKLTSVMQEQSAAARADAGRRAAWLISETALVVLRKSWQVAHNHDWN
jgi:hypothetical protein